MPRKTSFCNAALLRSDIKRYWPLLFLYVAVWVVILPMQILSASRECDGVADGIMTVLQLKQHNVIIRSMPASVVMSLLFGCFAAMAVWSYLMSGRTVGLMHALPVTRTQAFFSHILSVLGALTAGNVLIFLLTALCSAGFSYVDWAALGTWLLLTELMALFFFALGSLCAMVTGWLLAVPVLYGAVNVIAVLLHLVVQAMAQMFYYGYVPADIPAGIRWLTPVGRIWDAVANGGAQPIEVQFPEPIGTQSYHRFQLPASAFSTCIIYAAVGIALLALVWWLYKKRPSETAGDAMSFRWLQPIARWSIGLCGGWGLGLFLNYVILGSSSFAGLLICQLVMGVICFFAAQMLLKKKFRIFTSRWWVETLALVLTLLAVTLCIKLDITGYQHRVPDAEDVTSVRFSASYADFTTDDPAAVESVISLHRAILEQYDETGERLENQTYLDTEGGPTTRYVRVDYQLRNGTSLCREWRVSIVNGSDIHRLLTQLVNRTDSRAGMIGISELERYGGVNAVVGGYVNRYDTGEFAELSQQQAQELAMLAQADAENSSMPIDPLSDEPYVKDDKYRLEVQLRVVIDRETSTTVPLSVRNFALRMQRFIDELEFEAPVDGSDYVEQYYDDYDMPATYAVDEIIYD